MTTTKDGRDAAATEPEPVTNPVVPDTDESEILGLHSAIEKVLAKIKWHEEQIEERRQDIKGHEDQIEELRVSLRKHVGPLMNQTIQPRSANNGVAARNNGSNGKNGRKVATTESATGDLIFDFLRKQGKPVDTKQVKEHLEKQGNTTNPSVELSRMVKKNQIERAGRGLYQLKK